MFTYSMADLYPFYMLTMTNVSMVKQRTKVWWSNHLHIVLRELKRKEEINLKMQCYCHVAGLLESTISQILHSKHDWDAFLKGYHVRPEKKLATHKLNTILIRRLLLTEHGNYLQHFTTEYIQLSATYSKSTIYNQLVGCFQSCKNSQLLVERHCINSINFCQWLHTHSENAPIRVKLLS